MLGTIAREWLRMNSEFRLSLKSELSKGRLTIREIRLQAGNLRRHDGPDAESDVAAQEVIVTLDGSRGWLQSRCMCCWSLFALARRLGHPPCSDTDLLEDCALVVDATTSGTIVPGADFKVVTDPATGASWCGRGLLGQDAQGKKLPALVIRTWRCGDA